MKILPVVAELVEIFSDFYCAQRSLPYSEKRVIRPYFEPGESISYHHITFILKMYFNIILSHEPLTEMSTRNIKIIMFLGSKVRPVSRADNLTAIYLADCPDNVGSLTSHNPIGLQACYGIALLLLFLCAYVSYAPRSLLDLITLIIQWNLYKAESEGTENIFHIGQVSALYKIATKKMLNPLKSHYLHGAYLFISQNRQRWLL
jgi:hypothetical protein